MIIKILDKIDKQVQYILIDIAICLIAAGMLIGGVKLAFWLHQQGWV